MSKLWTDEEIKILKEEYSKRNGLKNEDLLLKLSNKLNRSQGSIRNKACELKITSRDKYYTEEQIQFLKDNFNKLSYEDMAIILKKDGKNVFRKCKQLGLINKKQCETKLQEKKIRIFTEKDKQELSIKAKEWHKTHNHPKGMENKHHTVESKNKISKSNKQVWKNYDEGKLLLRNLKQRQTRIKNGTLNPLLFQKNPYSRSKGGKRKDLNNIYFRSSWEANMARYYNYIGVEWQFEPKTFIFKDITRGSVSYTPDFYLPKEDTWIEVKGWMDGKSKTKLKRFAKQYPEEYKKLKLITKKEYNEIKRKVAPFIKEWE